MAECNDSAAAAAATTIEQTNQPNESQNETTRKQTKLKTFANWFRGKSRDRTTNATSSSTKGLGCSALSWLRASKRGKEEKLDKRPTVKQKKNKAVQGQVVFDRTTNPDFWDRILKNSILGPGLILKAVICNRETFAINAYGPDDFTPSVEQLKKVALLVQSERADYVVQEKDFIVALDKCTFREVNTDQMMLATVTELNNPQPNQPAPVGEFELGALLAKNSLLIAIYLADAKVADARKMLCELRDYFFDQGL